MWYYKNILNNGSGSVYLFLTYVAMSSEKFQGYFNLNVHKNSYYLNWEDNLWSPTIY